MRKLFILLAATAALLITASCNLKVENDYTFSYELNYQVSTEEQETIIKDYFEAFFNEHGNYSFHGEYSDALAVGITYFMQDLKLVDSILINNTLETENDVVRMIMVMAAKNTRVAVAYNDWVGGTDGAQLQQLLQ